MGLKIYWTDFARSQLKSIYDYHKHNVSSKIALQITKQIVDNSENLSDFPKLGAVEELLKDKLQSFRFIVSSNYKIIYWENLEKNRIEIIDVFDVRQNPVKIQRNK